MAQSNDSALIALSLEYADAVKDQDIERWSETWVEDCRWILDDRRDVIGREAVVEMWKTAIAKYTKVVQLYLSSTFDVDGDSATGRCEFLELNRRADGSGHILAGYYVDEYRRTSEGWRFVSRRLTKNYQGSPDLLGTFAGLD